MIKTHKSAQIRQEGNTYYLKAQAAGISPVLKKQRLQNALQCYTRAINESPTRSALMASAVKNYAKAAWAMARAVQESDKDMSQVTFYYKESISHFTKVIQVEYMAETWADELSIAYKSCLDGALQTLAEYPITKRVAGIEVYIHCMQDDMFKPDCIQEIANLLFHHAATSLGSGDYKTSLWALKECYKPIEELKICAANREDLQSEASVLDNDVRFHTASAESLQAIDTGDNLLEVVLKNEESLNIDMVYDVIDWYKKAVLLAREIEIEKEAVACSRLGKIFDQVLKITFRARVYFEKCMQLAHSMKPRMFTSEAWFRTAADTLQRYQDASLVNQQEQEKKENEKYKEEIKDDLATLELIVKKYQYKDDNAELIAAIYEKFPPKNANHRCPEKEDMKLMDDNALKKVVMKAIHHYHPDTQDVAKHGKKWSLFCDEITKLLTKRYEYYKLNSSV